MIFAFFQFFTWLLSNFIGRVFLNMRVKGRENLKSLKQGGVLFVSNHSGKFDPFFIGAALPRSHYRHIKCFRYLTYYKYITCKWYGPLIWLSGAYPVYKESKKLDEKLAKTISLLKDGQDVLIFPTAKINKYFKAEDARPGVAHIVKEINPQIVPVFIKNTHKIKFKDILFRTRNLEIVFGKPFYKEISSGYDNKKIAKDIMIKVKGLVRFPPTDNGRSYLDITNRDAFFKNEAVQYLFSVIPGNIKEKLINNFLSDTYKDKEELLKFFLRESKMFRLINAFPGSAEAFEYLYLEKEPENLIDKYFLKCKSGIQTHKRLLSLDQNLLYWIKKLCQNEPLIIDNFFSGPGRDLIRIVKQNPEIKKMVNIRNVDIDPRAIVIGKKLTEAEGLTNVFSYECKSFVKAKPRNVDLMILVGVLCPLRLHVSERLLLAMRRYIKPGGHIIYSTAQHSLLNDDPFTDFLMRLSAWPMSYKSDEEAWDLANESGWQPITQFFDEPSHHHCMTVAKKI